MNAILGMSHLALEAQSADKRRNLLQTVEHSAQNLLRLLDDILDFSKMEAGQLQLNEAPFDLRTLVAGVLATMQVPATEKGLRLEGDLPEEPPWCFWGDELRLRQILLNLVTNGIKFTETGSIAIRAAVAGNADAGGKRLVRLTVTDTGIGIVEEKLPRIFDRFEQADTSYARKYGGVGLGLAICQQLATLMGGTISVESRKYLGSSFHVAVPLRPCTEEEMCAKGTGRSADRPLRKGLRILVVDDNAVNRDVASMTLEHEHIVASAGNGIEALHHLAAAAFDVVLMDVQMPIMDGLTATSVIRAVEEDLPFSAGLPEETASALVRNLRGRHVPIVAMTAHALGDDREMCLAAGMDAYLTKPFQPGQLEEVLMAVVEEGESGEEPGMPVDAEGEYRAEETPPEPAIAAIRSHLQATTALHPDQVERITAAALQSIAGNLALASEALERRDFREMGRAAHTLKGTLLQCGLAQWAEKAQEIHTGAKDNRDLPYAEMIAALARGLAPLTSATEKRG